MVTVIVGEMCTFSFQFHSKMLKCVFCALLYMHNTINTDDGGPTNGCKTKAFYMKHISYYNNNLICIRQSLNSER